MATYSASNTYSMEGYRSTTKTQAPSSPPRGHVGFSISNKEAKKEEKTKYLTARYGQHQMMLIRKRLAVEDWLYDELRELYNCENDSDDHSCKLDLEDILNIDTDRERRDHALSELIDVRQPKDVVHKFIDELIRRAKTL